MTHPAPVLPLGHYRAVGVARTPIALPEFCGFAWRGLFGHALKRSVCTTRRAECAGCLLHATCLYPTVFETAPPAHAAKMRRYRSVPHPYVLRPAPDAPRLTGPGEAIDVELVLVGEVNRHLPVFIHAFHIAGDLGIGPGHGRFELSEWQQHGAGGWTTLWRQGETPRPADISTPVVPAPPAAIRMHFDTPLRLKRDEDLVTPDTFAFHDLARNLLRRVSMLSYFHTDTPYETDFAALTRRARDVALTEKNLRWLDLRRYSNRQETAMQMGGLVGEIALETAQLGELWPLLWIGQWVHAGKGAVMGLGRYRVKAVSAAPAP
ncbi:MAG: CRISPR system precrRNA processing endoribonuclease RAMP protein Cas6 [Betaproteobacteria bacterium]|nr:CRISPR system precrRNA processing endoribonuclease RAMP protein Cas6 [Betaproteobacteria bacterium]